MAQSNCKSMPSDLPPSVIAPGLNSAEGVQNLIRLLDFGQSCWVFQLAQGRQHFHQDLSPRLPARPRTHHTTSAVAYYKGLQRDRQCVHGGMHNLGMIGKEGVKHPGPKSALVLAMCLT